MMASLKSASHVPNNIENERNYKKTFHRIEVGKTYLETIIS